MLMLMLITSTSTNVQIIDPLLMTIQLHASRKSPEPYRVSRIV